MLVITFLFYEKYVLTAYYLTINLIILANKKFSKTTKFSLPYNAPSEVCQP